MIKLIIDTDVVVAALRSPGGASAALLVMVLTGQVSMMLSVALALEYEAVCMLAEHRLAANASERDVRDMLDALIDAAVPVEVHYQWRPQLNDAGDEMVLEAAVNGRADILVTFNHKDYRDAPAQFGIEILTPAQTLRRIRQ